jgi:hypothetical protein
VTVALVPLTRVSADVSVVVEVSGPVLRFLAAGATEVDQSVSLLVKRMSRALTFLYFLFLFLLLFFFLVLFILLLAF